MDDRVVSKRLQLLQGLAIKSSRPIGGWEVRTANHDGPGHYRFHGDWSPAGFPEELPAGWTAFFRARGTAPASLPLDDAYLSFAFHDLEGLLTVNGHPHSGLDWNHTRVPLPRNGRLALEIECIAVPSVLYMPEHADQKGIFRGGSIVVVDRQVEALYYDLSFAWETARSIADPRRKALLDAAVEAALLAIDLTLPRPQLLAEVAQARALLTQRLAAIAPDGESGGIYAVGHSHIDAAWLWPLRETVRKCARTFSTACRLMERFPDFHFTCSQAQLYRYTREHYPALYRQMRRWVKAGRWETGGAMWVEADCNVTGGESLVRQMLYGIDFFRREFGTRPRLCWLPDVFGYPASLPGLLAGCGVEAFYTYKLHWQARNPFPYHLFRWRGIDGAEVLAHVVNHLGCYNNTMSPEALSKGWSMYAQKAEHPEVIFPFGFGDGGGGVTEEMLEAYARAKGRFPGLPAVRMGTAEQYFADAAMARPALPVWDGELYVETHRGTYTTQSALKRANRQSELLLRDAEMLGSLAKLAGRPFDAATLREPWEQVLLHQFHDILPGSSIGMVYAEAMPVLARVQETARKTCKAAMAHLAGVRRAGTAPDALCIWNSLGWARQDVVTARIPIPDGPLWAVDAEGTRRPVQVVSRNGRHATIVFSPGTMPSIGMTTVQLAPGEPADETTLAVDADHMENRFFHLTLDRDGGIARLYDKLNRRDVLATGAVGNDLQLLQDGPEHEDAWNVHETIDKRRYPIAGPTTLRAVEHGPVRAVVRVSRRHRESVIEQDIVIYADLPRIDFVTRVDWRERQTLLKAAFPLAIRTTRATYEVQFGACERATHRNTSWDQQKFEVPAQRWADMSESGYGVSLLNDSRYGYDARDHVLRLTLLRGTTFPDPEADRGRHEFTYSLLPHAGDWQQAQTVRRALELNVPATALPVRCGPTPPPARVFIEAAGTPVVIEALKPAENGRGLILRLYEPHGARGAVTIRLGFPVARAFACNLVEEGDEPLPLRSEGLCFDIRPFQIRAFRLIPDGARAASPRQRRRQGRRPAIDRNPSAAEA